MLSRTAVIAAPIEVVRAYLPDNYRAVRIAGAPGQVLIIGHDVAGWTLDGYVIPRLASGLHFAREERADVYIGTSPEPDVEGLREVAYLVRPGLSHSAAWHAALGRTPTTTTQKPRARVATGETARHFARLVLEGIESDRTPTQD